MVSRIMKKFYITACLVFVSTYSQAIDRSFAEGFSISKSSANTSKNEGGLSLLNGKLAFSRNDTVYITELSDSFDIATIKPMNDLSALGIEGQFAHSGNTLIFSKGGELYQAELVNKQWVNPKRLNIEGLGGGRTEVRGTSFAARRWTYKVPAIKGMYNPALSKNGKRLYFVAEFEGGAGGKDIWYTERKPDGKSWSAPTNFTAVNSPANEDFPFLAGDSAFYFSSAKNDTLGGSNIFKAKLKSNETPVMLPSEFNSNSNDFNFVVANGCPFLISNREGGDDIYRPALKAPVIVETPVDTVPVDTTPPAKIVMKDYKTCVFYFDFDKTSLIDSYEQEFAYIFEFVNANPESKFTINGHTDSRGNDNYNMNLSNKRAKIVYDRLIQMGIDKKRLTYKGFGETQPDIKDAVTDEEHQKNRRVEIIKLD